VSINQACKLDGLSNNRHVKRYETDLSNSGKNQGPQIQNVSSRPDASTAGMEDEMGPRKSNLLQVYKSRRENGLSTEIDF